MTSIKEALEKLFAQGLPELPKPDLRKKPKRTFKEPTRQKHVYKRAGFTHNHSKGISKKRRKMAKESRRINRS